MRRIKIIMATMEEYDEQWNEGFRNYPDIHHILLSNCHKYSDWIEKSIDAAHEDDKTRLMIGVDV